MAETTIYPHPAGVTTPDERGGWWRRLAPLAVLAAGAAALGYVLAFNPTDTVPDPTGPCLWHAIFGIDGPTCGGTRMVWYLLHGDIVQAARHHLLALVAVPFVVYAYLQWLVGWTFGRRLPRWRPSMRLVVGYVVMFLLYAVVLRNLPWVPFDWFYVANLV